MSAARINGALAALAALRQLEQAADDIDYDDDSMRAFHLKRLTDAKAFAATFGPLTPEQEGALVAVAEYLHTLMTTGQPDIQPGRWVPHSTLTDDEAQALTEAEQASADAFNAECAKRMEKA
jgi:hypothetical protein